MPIIVAVVVRRHSTILWSGSVSVVQDSRKNPLVREASVRKEVVPLGVHLEQFGLRAIK
jgi:hypothetical protein